MSTQEEVLATQEEEIADLAEAVIKLMDCEQAAGKVFNIGSSKEISIEELADKIIEMTGSKSRKEF